MVGRSALAAISISISIASSVLVACALVAGVGDEFGFGDGRSDGSAPGVDAQVGDASNANDAASSGDGGAAAVANSCTATGDGLTNCGGGAESCCTSLLVTGGTFSRSYDGVNGAFMNPGYKASVADFRLDKYEITVGRFRAFADAARTGWKPAPGSGKHKHLNNGSGLVLPGVSSYETGWDSAWDAALATLADGRTSDLSCQQPMYATWTNTPGLHERHPINCETWFEAYAFCIWDGGFLPSEAEWNYAAAGGSQQRVYPWSSPPTSNTIDCSYSNYGGAIWPNTACVDAGPNRAGSEPRGDGRWGQSDLAGNAGEWVLDWYSNPYPPGECANCSQLTEARFRVVRGGAFLTSSAVWVLSAFRGFDEPTSRSLSNGVRCARTP